MLCQATPSSEDAHAEDVSAFICFSSLRGSSNSLVTKDLSEVCTLAGRVMSQPGICPITEQHSLFPTSHTRNPVGLPCGWLAGEPARLRAYRVPRSDTTG